jgi:hypothetical protein
MAPRRCVVLLTVIYICKHITAYAKGGASAELKRAAAFLVRSPVAPERGGSRDKLGVVGRRPGDLAARRRHDAMQS